MSHFISSPVLLTTNHSIAITSGKPTNQTKETNHMNYPDENTTQGTIETLSKIEKRLKKEKQSLEEMNIKLFKLMEDIVKKKNTINDMENHIEWKFQLN
jgi:hypothetical protein